jgi:hypothetical protein
MGYADSERLAALGCALNEAQVELKEISKRVESLEEEYMFEVFFDKYGIRHPLDKLGDGKCIRVYVKNKFLGVMDKSTKLSSMVSAPWIKFVKKDGTIGRKEGHCYGYNPEELRLEADEYE